VGISSRNKGKSGEYEVRDLLQLIVDEAYATCGKQQPPKVERNSLEQFKNGGVDLVCPILDFMSIEIKRQETCQLEQWWQQTINQAKIATIPVLIYRSNYQPWKVRTIGSICLAVNVLAVHGIPVDISWEYFSRILLKTILIKLGASSSVVISYRI
jgi:hypothetical protein